MAGASRTREVDRSAPAKAPPPRDPSWGRVLATTISLWTRRRMPRMRRPRLALLLALCVLIAAVAVATAVQLTSTTAKTARTGSPGSPHRGAVRAGAPAVAPGSAAAIRAQAAAWVAGQVSGDQSIACDPAMCAALGAHGVASGRLMPLRPATGAPAANVIVTSPASQAQASQDAPVLLASFGTGASQVEVRATVPGGAAAYARAQQADLAARRSGGAQLLHSQSIQAGAGATAQLRAGQVDSRILIMLAMLASQHPWRVAAFGGASPGVPLADAPFRQVIITGNDAKTVAAALALIRAQQAPYAPAQATAVRLAGGQPGLRIDFAAPAPLGLLTGNASG
ncbi:MAG: hypothetical protein ABSB59_15990 [Streptosporangiaceae bacterium]